MSPEADRIPVPTNGNGPHRLEEPAVVLEEPSPANPSVPFTPTQLAVGFGILASLIALAVGRMRRRGRQGRGRFGRRR